MEHSPPPVPPKDAGYHSGVEDVSRPPTAASGSKRKRQHQDYDFRSGRLEAVDLDGQTPKRSRSHVGVSDNETSNDETPAQNRSVRRKKGHRNLSMLNLRHAASSQTVTQHHHSPTRESRFQEGSLTDKPSEKPPSVFIRLPHPDSGELSYREELMEDYEEGMPTPRDSLEAALQYEKDTRDQRVAEINAREKKEDSGGIFRFGKSLASTFHPVTLWNRLWSEQKDELTRQNMLDAERKAKLKTQAEEKYAQMKHAGQLGLQPVSFDRHRDSGIAFESGPSERNHGHVTPSWSVPRQDQEQHVGWEESGSLESAAKPGRRGIKSRLHLRPSLQSLQNSIIKRVRSDANIRSSADRESTSSASPTKVEFGEHNLLRSASKHDLKRQQKLSKRVSDLEAKLVKARSELSDALVQASPMPKLGNRHERFTPVSTLRKSKFVPGALPTLHSEGVLFPKQLDPKGDEERVASDNPPWHPLDLSKAFDDISEDEETIKAPREKPYPARAKEIFERPEEANEQDTALDERNDSGISTVPQTVGATHNATEITDMDPNSLADFTGDGASTGTTDPSYDALDVKLKALESTAKAASRKHRTSKKRAARNDDLREFKPGVDEDEDDDAEWEAAHKTKKKQKSAGTSKNSPSKQRTVRAKDSKPLQRKTVRTTYSTGTTAIDHQKNGDKGFTAVHEEVIGKSSIDTDDGSEDELNKGVSARASITSEDVTLEPVYEEEEETMTTTVPLKDVPSKPTAKATPARFGYNAARSRSNSPNKHTERAVDVALRKRQGQSASPKSHTQQVDNDVVAVLPGNGDVPLLPKSPNVGVTGTKSRELRAKVNYEWPDDVF